MENNDQQQPILIREENNIFSDLEILCKSSGYIHVIAYFIWRDILIVHHPDQITENDILPKYSYERLIGTEISTLIGLLAKHSIDWSIPEPITFKSYIDKTQELLHELHHTILMPSITAIESPEKAKQINLLNSASFLREPIFYGSETVYSFQYTDFAKLRYQADDQWIKENKGFSIQEASDLLVTLGKYQEQKVYDHLNLLKEIPPEECTVLDGFKFNIDELIAETGLERCRIESMLNAFCFDPGKSNHSFENQSDFNETNVKPILKCDDDTFVLLQYHSLCESLYESPYFWMLDDESYRPIAARHRGKFAEQFVYDRLSTIFDERHVYKNIEIYKGKNRISEIDVLVLYGQFALVIQVKSKRLTIESRKGNDCQLKDDFKKAVQDAYDQCVICTKGLLGDKHRFLNSDGTEVHFSDKPTIIFPICIVSDYYPALEMQSRQFLSTQSTEALQAPVVTDIFSVDIMVELLNSPLQFLNYVMRRSKLDEKIISGNELSILGFYLKQNLWVDEQWDGVVIDDDFMATLDHAMFTRRLDIPGDKNPKNNLNRFDNTIIGNLLEQIERSAEANLIELGMLLHTPGNNTIDQMNELLGIILDPNNDHHDFSIPFSDLKSGITFHVNFIDNKLARKNLLAHCEMRKYKCKANQWFGLLLTPQTGLIRDICKITWEWKYDPKMEEQCNKWPKKQLATFSKLTKKKIGRNVLCPCGSGKKYKKCCL